MRVKRILESTQVKGFSINADTSLERLRIVSGKANSEWKIVNSANRLPPLILMIRKLNHIAKVGYSVVIPVAVDMVNSVFGPIAEGVKPCQAMGKVMKDLDVSVSLRDVPGNLAGQGSVEPFAIPSATLELIWRSILPDEYSRLGIVVKDCAQFVRSNIRLNHEALLLLIGQRPQRVSARLGLRHFRTE